VEDNWIWILIGIFIVVGIGTIIRLINFKTISSFIIFMISDRDKVSSKRVLAIIAFLLMSISYWYSIFTHTNIPDYMWDGFLYIVLAAFFFSSIDKFSNFRNRN
jgi:hypothetical protein